MMIIIITNLYSNKIYAADNHFTTKQINCT